MSVIQKVVQRGLCSGCGVCAGICPQNALSMETMSDGDLACSLTGQCRESCHLCESVCPFVEGCHAPRSLNVQLFKSEDDPSTIFNKNIGWYRQCLVGFSNVAGHRTSGSSGGMITWCLENLLRKGLIEKATVVRRSTSKNGQLFEFKVANTVDELRHSGGSIYHPVEISSLIKKILSEKSGRWAVVGVPCLCTALRKATLRIPRLAERVEYILGMACGMYQNTMYTEMLLAMSGLSPSEAGPIFYRRKSPQGPASNFGFQAFRLDGTGGKFIQYKGLPYFLGRHAYFRYDACNYCKDVFAESADACFMDAWLPEYNADPQGTSLVVARSNILKELIVEGQRSGKLALEPVKPERVVRSQIAHVRRKQELIQARFSGEAELIGDLSSTRWMDYLDIWLQQHTQKRSKTAWARYGRRFGRWAFLVSTIDLFLAQKILFHWTPRALSLSKSLIRKGT